MSVKRNLWSVGICWIGDSFKERTRRVMSSKRATKLLLAVTIAVGLGLLLPRISRCLRGWIVEWRISRYTASIEKHARAQSLPPDLVRAVIRAESAGNPRAVSISQARGLMQINAVTEQEIRERFRLPAGDIFDPDYNIQAGTAYLRYLVNRFQGHVRLALAAYHAGPTRMQQLCEDHPECSPGELIEQFAPVPTRAYCQRILGDESPRLPITPDPRFR